MLTTRMTPTKLQERMDELDGRVDTDQLVDALWYVRDDGRR
jgi:hypothetical protein